MSRILIPVPTGPPDRVQLVVGATPVDENYGKPYKPEDFRAWAADVDTIHSLMAADPTGRQLHERLTADPMLKQTHGRIFGDPNDGINGHLTTVDGESRVELQAGQHRAYYQMERGYSYTPVWVRADDDKQLAAFQQSCAGAMRQADPRLADAYDHPTFDRVDRGAEAREGRERDLFRERSFGRGEIER